jgi:hypothetical protein
MKDCRQRFVDENDKNLLYDKISSKKNQKKQKNEKIFDQFYSAFFTVHSISNKQSQKSFYGFN